MGKNIGFISTRFAGTDGVTLEASKWAQIFRHMGYQCFWFAGHLDKSPERSMLIPEAFFQHEQNQWINAHILGKKSRSAEVTDAIQNIKTYLKIRIKEFIKKFSIDLLVPQNALTIPMHVPLGIAITEIIAETQIPTIAHHHDFYWERTRFVVNAVGDYLRMAFPPNLPNMEHVVINSAAQEELALRTGIASIVIPNIIDFDRPYLANQKMMLTLRERMGLKSSDIMFLQPTRIVQRKGIEHAIDLVENLKNPHCKLVICHEAGDEGMDYAEWLKEEARRRNVDLRLFGLRMHDPWSEQEKKESEYTLFDVYPCADFITYPSLYEGFGNAFLEAIYFKKPILINRYATFVRDIEPKGFDLVVMDGFLTQKTVGEVQKVITSKERRDRMVNHNYQVGTRYYSYAVLRRCLNSLMTIFFGMEKP